MGSERVTVPAAERGHIEFKSRLIQSYHLKPERRQHLVAQMRARLEEGKGVAVYVIGVDDEGEVAGLNQVELEESIAVVRALAAECGASVKRVERFSSERGEIAKVVIEALTRPMSNHVTLGVAGHVNHGKSTLIACLLTGESDDGTKWLYMDTLPHEIARNLSADLHFAVLGFKDGKPMLVKNPLDRRERARVVSEADKVVSIVDTVGHEPWLRTTIRGLLGQEVDYGLVVVAADDGPTHITREHLGILFAAGIPVILCVTKADKVGSRRLEEVREEVARLVKRVGRVPMHVREPSDLHVVIDKLNVVVPILETSSVTRQGFDLLYQLLSMLPARPKPSDRPFLMYIDRVYDVEGTGTVVSGTILQGRLRSGATLLLGPDRKGEFAEVRARSIEIHNARVEEAEAGQIVGIALKGVPHDSIRRGMVIADREVRPRAIWSFEAEVLILSHPTRIASGYEPIVHCHTIAQSARMEILDREYLKPGEQGRVRFTFKYRPEFLRAGDVFVLREGRVKGIGRVTSVG